MQIPDDYTLERFVEDYLPDYEERVNKAFDDYFPPEERDEYDKEWVEDERFICHHDFALCRFPEALRAFGKKLCEEQREICQDIVDDAYAFSNDKGERLSQFEALYQHDVILSAPFAIDIEQ